MGFNMWARQCVSAVVLLLGFGIAVFSASAGTYELLYDSFEAPDISGQSDEVPPGWSRQSFGANDYSEMWDEDTGFFTSPYGSQVIACWSLSGYVTTSINAVLQPGTTYTLTFNVENYNVDAGAPRSDNEYTAYLYAGTNLLSSVTGLTTTNDMSVSNVVTYAVGDSHPALGEQMKVYLQLSGGEWHAKALFDNVRLIAEETSEWARTLFFGK